MKIAFDTSVLVAAAVGSHPRHKEAAALLDFSQKEEHSGFLCSHAMAEIYSVLTKIPLVQRISPAEAFSVVRALCDLLVVAPCDGPRYDDALQRCVARNLTSGVVFDALHLIAAESVRADVLLTFNVRDFERLKEANSPRIADTL